jgi:hypothetical protein
MRHAHVLTTLWIYAHTIPQRQRDAIERSSIGTSVSLERAAADQPTEEEKSGGSVGESNPRFGRRAVEPPALKTGRITGPPAPPGRITAERRGRAGTRGGGTPAPNFLVSETLCAGRTPHGRACSAVVAPASRRPSVLLSQVEVAPMGQGRRGLRPARRLR